LKSTIKSKHRCQLLVSVKSLQQIIFTATFSILKILDGLKLPSNKFNIHFCKCLICFEINQCKSKTPPLKKSFEIGSVLKTPKKIIFLTALLPDPVSYSHIIIANCWR